MKPLTSPAEKIIHEVITRQAIEFTHEIVANLNKPATYWSPADIASELATRVITELKVRKDIVCHGVSPK